jgi:transcriptional regulator with XRE-family HTH domain
MREEPTPTLDSVGTRIAGARTRKGISPSTVATVLEIDEEQYLTLVETGKMRLDISEIARCADVLSVTTRELLGIPETPRQALIRKLTEDPV